MFEKLPQLFPVLLLLAASGCESLYYSALKTSGTWTGTASTMTLVGGETNQEIQVAALRIAGGPEWTNPPHTSHVNVIGREFVLVDNEMHAFPSERWPLGTELRVQGLMRTDVAFDQNGQRLYATHQRKYLVPSIRVKKAQRAGREVAILFADASTAPSTNPAARIKLIAKAVSSERIDLSWTPVKDAVAYRVEVSSDGKEFDQSAEMDASEPRCSNEGFEPNEQYYFRVRAIRRTGAEWISNVAEATTLQRPPSTKPIVKPATIGT